MNYGNLGIRKSILSLLSLTVLALLIAYASINGMSKVVLGSGFAFFAMVVLIRIQKSIHIKRTLENNKSKIKNIFMLMILLIFTIPYSNQGITKPVILVFGMLFLVLFLLLLSRVSDVIKLISKNPLLFLFVGYTVSTWAWADHSEPSPTIRIAKFLVVTLLGIYFVINYSPKDCLKLIVINLSILSILNLITVLLIPSIGIHTEIEHSGLWRGISGHKNALGTLSLLCLMGNFILLYNQQKKYVHIFFMILSAFLIFKSGSTTALIMTILTAGILHIGYLRNIKHPSLKVSVILSSFTAVLSFGFLVLNNISVFAADLGKDMTFTGRTWLWESANQAIKEHLLFGYGFGSFFNNSDRVLNYFPFEVTSSHSGFRDLLLDLGLIGLSLIVLITLKSFIGIVRHRKIFSFDTWMLTFGFITFIILNNITDSRFLNSVAIYWLIFFVCITCIQKERSAHLERT